ncbi:hypothetical protein OXX69_002909 [Metschnikowia pulcherrima]
MYPQAPENEKREYYSEPSTPSESTPPMYPSPHARESQPRPPPGHYGPYGYHEQYFGNPHEFSRAGGVPPPPPPPHHGRRPHPDDPFFYEGKHRKPHKKGIMHKVLIGSAAACGGFLLFNMGRGYEFNAMREGAHHPHDIARHGGPHMQHEFSAEGMHRGEGRPRLFGHAGEFGHHGEFGHGPKGFRPDFKPDYKPDFDPEFSGGRDHSKDIADHAGFRPLDDPHGPPPFPEFGMHHGKPHPKGRKGPKGAKGKHHRPEMHEEFTDESGDESNDESEVAGEFKEKLPHGKNMRNGEEGPKGPHRKHQNKPKGQRSKDETIKETPETTSEVASEKSHSEVNEKTNPLEGPK